MRKARSAQSQCQSDAALGSSHARSPVSGEPTPRASRPTEHEKRCRAPHVDRCHRTCDMGSEVDAESASYLHNTLAATPLLAVSPLALRIKEQARDLEAFPITRSHGGDRVLGAHGDVSTMASLWRRDVHRGSKAVRVPCMRGPAKKFRSLPPRVGKSDARES